MNHQFKPGDLAMIINSGQSEDLGKVVKILEVLLDDQSYYKRNGEIHEGDRDGSPSAFVEFEDGDVWMFSQSWLMPLRGDFHPE